MIKAYFLAYVANCKILSQPKFGLAELLEAFIISLRHFTLIITTIRCFK